MHRIKSTHRGNAIAFDASVSPSLQLILKYTLPCKGTYLQREYATKLDHAQEHILGAFINKGTKIGDERGLSTLAMPAFDLGDDFGYFRQSEVVPEIWTAG